MDIGHSFDQLICKYNIDRHIPGFRRFLRAKELMVSFFGSLKSNEDIVIVGSQKTPITWFRKNICKNQKICECVIGNHSVMPEMICKNREAACYIIVSYDFKEKLKVKIKEAGGNVISIYDLFEDHGLYFEHDFFDVYGLTYHDFRTKEINRDFKDFDINEVYFWNRRNYEIERDSYRRKCYLQKLIFDCAYAKDFCLLKFYIDKYVEEYESCEEYINFFKEVSDLLRKTAMCLKNRNQKDCLMVWLDALEYGEDEELPFLHGLDEKALVLDHIFTVTPYTRATFKTLFGGMCVIEDQSFKVEQLNEKNSAFLRDIKRRGYLFKYYGGYADDFLEHEQQSDHFYSIYTPITQIFFDILCDIALLKKDEKVFYVLHEDLQTHIPYISLGLKGTDYINHEAWAGKQEENEKVLQNRQAIESRDYIDRQLEFWSSILPECMFKIYMSDHGHTFLGRFHPIMKICQKLPV